MSSKKNLPTIRSSAAEYLTFIAATGQGGVEAVYADEDVWLSQKMMGELYGVNVRTVSEHLKNIFSDQELEQEAVIRNFRITASDGKNYNTQPERNIPMTMQDWETRLNRFIEAADREVLQDAGKISKALADAHALSEFEKYRVVQDRLYESDFDKAVKAQLTDNTKGQHNG